jgi:gliding motility-associated-like protein
MVEHAFSTDGIYEVILTVYNQAGCSKQIMKQLRVGDGYTLLIPNVFTPNNDGINDVFEPKFSGLKTISMYIFDSYGNMLHESPESGGVDASGDIVQPTIIPWNGNNANNANKMYVYRILGTLVNDEVIEKTGTIQILK